MKDFENKPKPPFSIFDVFDLMQTSETNHEEIFAKGSYLKDFEYQRYEGKNVKIAEVQHSFEYKGKRIVK